jgi:hypothetical protein
MWSLTRLRFELQPAPDTLFVRQICLPELPFQIPFFGNNCQALQQPTAYWGQLKQPNVHKSVRDTEADYDHLKIHWVTANRQLPRRLPIFRDLNRLERNGYIDRYNRVDPGMEQRLDHVVI